MKWIVASLWALCASQAFGADKSALRAFETGNDTRGWEAVGRLNIGRSGFCTGALIAPDLVLTAAHCLYSKHDGKQVALNRIEFLAGWRNGRAQAYRKVRRAVQMPDYQYRGDGYTGSPTNDLALLELDRPIRNPSIRPFQIAGSPRKGDPVGVVSYAKDRSEAASIQELCHVLARRIGTVIVDCDVDFGASGAPIFNLSEGAPAIVSVVSSKSIMRQRNVAIGVTLGDNIGLLQARLERDEGVIRANGAAVRRFGSGTARSGSSAKFLKSQ